MLREKVTVKDFSSIAKTYKHYVWHFIQKKQNRTRLTFYSYFDKTHIQHRDHVLVSLIDSLNLPYFESYTEESIDFLMDCNIHGSNLYKPTYDPIEYIHRRRFYTPLFAGFNHYNLVNSTLNFCYCPEGLVNVVAQMDMKYIFDLESKIS